MDPLLPTFEKMYREMASEVRHREAVASATPAQRAACNWSLATFTRAAWHIIEPTTPLIWSWALDAMCAHVQALLDGTLGCRNLMILVPPGFGKSTIVSVAAPAWRWIKRPSWRSIFASGNESVSLRDSMKSRDIVGSRWYHNAFITPWTIDPDQDAKALYKNTATGFRMAVSAGSRITGDRADSLFVDDALDAADSFSKAERERVQLWWNAAFGNRLSDMGTGTRCIIQQRLHPQDLAGHVLDLKSERWEVLVIPQEWEESRRVTTSMGWTDPRTEDGQLAFPERFPAEVVQSERIRLGSSAFAGQHQQRPAVAGGEIFKRVHLKLLPADALPTCTQTIVSVDSAFKAGQESDYSVACVLGQFDQGVIILDLVRGRWPYPQLRRTIEEIAARVSPSALLIEDAASGQSLIQDLMASTALPVKPVKVNGDKLTRAHTIVPSWEAGRIFAPVGAFWLDDLLDELAAFPKGAHDDQTDALVQGVRYLTQAQPGEEWAKYLGTLTTPSAAAPSVSPREVLWLKALRGGASVNDL